jgi:DNA-binding LytR/AlgR family response regulator
MAQLRVLVVEDEPSTRAELAMQLAELPSVGEVVSAAGGDEAVRLLGSGSFDAAFLDIAMPGLTGMDVARILKRLSDPPEIVFVTAYDNHAVEAFGLGAADYLLKPFRPERLAGRTVFVRRDDIAYAEAHGDYVRLHSNQGSHLLRQSLTYLEQVWDAAGFVRAHRSFLINLAAVTELRVTSTAGLVAVTEPGEVPVSRRHSRLLRERLLQAAREGGTQR